MPNEQPNEQAEEKQPRVIRCARDITDLVNSTPVANRNVRAIVLIALGGIFIDAYDFTSISFGLKDITQQFHLGTFMVGVVGASIMVGALAGALVGGYLVDRLGRYQIFMADMVFFVISAIGCGISPNAAVLIFFRVLMGIGIGMDFPVALAFIAEYSALSGKGSRVSMWQVMWYFATSSTFVLLFILYWLVPAGVMWRWIIALGALPALIVMVVRNRYIQESPAWAANRGDLERAAQIVTSTYGIPTTVAPDADTTPPARAQMSLRRFRELFTPTYRGRTILGSTVSACQSMEYYAVGFGLPAIIAGLMHESTLTTILGSLVFNAVFGISGGFTGVRLTQRLGSWKLATSGFAVTFTVMIVLGLIAAPHGTTALVIVGLLLGIFVFFHAYGPGAQGSTLSTLAYPTSLRGTGGGFGHAIDRVGSTISLLVFPLISTAFATGAYFIVALAPAIGLVTLIAIRYDPTKHDADAEDYTAAGEGSGEYATA